MVHFEEKKDLVITKKLVQKSNLVFFGSLFSVTTYYILQARHSLPYCFREVYWLLEDWLRGILLYPLYLRT